jgi:rare lipoprotein A
MNNFLTTYTFIFLLSLVSNSIWSTNPPQKDKNKAKTTISKGTNDKPKLVPISKIDSLKLKPLTESVELIDTILIDKSIKFKFYKKNAHASYYAQKFQGKRTASGIRFDNNKYTAAHKKFPFGTKLRVTNEANGKSVTVEVTDRGPFSKVREIDLTKKAFMELVDNKNTGAVLVKIEVEDK